MPFISHAQNYEDVLLWRVLKDVEPGFYIDVGAWDPDHDSVTRAFSERGWRGINVEPVATHHARLVERRPDDINLAVAVGDAPGTALFYEVVETGLSTLDPALAAGHEANGFVVTSREVEIVTLGELCRQHAPEVIHFLKLDCEGAERAALAGADFGRFRPWIVLAEATEPLSQTASHAEWEDLLLAADYRFAWFDGLNRFYVAAEHFDRLAPLLAVPPNVFDRFQRVGEVNNTHALARNVVSGIYQALLFRGVDAVGLNDHVDTIVQTGRIDALLHNVLRSNEFLNSEAAFSATYFGKVG